MKEILCIVTENDQYRVNPIAYAVGEAIPLKEGCSWGTIVQRYGCEIDSERLGLAIVKEVGKNLSAASPRVILPKVALDYLYVTCFKSKGKVIYPVEFTILIPEHTWTKIEPYLK